MSDAAGSDKPRLDTCKIGPVFYHLEDQMKIAVFDTHAFEKTTFLHANEAFQHQLTFLDVRLSQETAILAKGSTAVCAFANDRVDGPCLRALKDVGVELVALRSAGYNHVDLNVANEVKLTVMRVPEYSPFSVAEHAVALMLTLNRKLHKAYNRVRDLNFSLDGLVGFDMHGKTVGIVGTGRIGSALAHIMRGFGCHVMATDLREDQALVEDYHVSYVSLERLLQSSDIISLHVPLTPDTYHMMNAKTLALTKPGAILINTSRGALVDTKALIAMLKNGHLGAAGLDVYEEESEVFFHDHSQDLLQDDVLARLLTFPNVFITSHQGFLTKEALSNIAVTTLQNASDFELGRPSTNTVKL